MGALATTWGLDGAAIVGSAGATSVVSSATLVVSMPRAQQLGQRESGGDRQLDYGREELLLKRARRGSGC